jgi:rhodanese-related sulfurtransferase
MKMTSRPNSSKVFLWVGILVLLAIVAGALFLNSNSTTKQANLPAEVSVAQALEMKNEGAFILDVRQPEEWEQGHIEGATLIPLGDLPNRINELPKDQDIVVVCRSGNRSAQARDMVRHAGLANSNIMAGGMNQCIGAVYQAISGP